MNNVTLSTWLLGLSVIFAVLFGLWGWTAQADALELTILDAIYRSIATLPVSDELLSESLWNSDWRIQIARWFGLLAFILGIIKIVLSVLSEQVNLLKAKLRSNHMMIIGDDPVAGAIADKALQDGTKVNWLGANHKQSTKKHGNLFVREGTWSMNEALKFALGKAKNVTVADNDDATAIAIAQQIRSKFANDKELKVNVVLRDPWLAMRIDDVEGVTDIRLISQAQAAIRQAHRKHPPFLLAQKHNHTQIHAVIVGFGLYGEAVLIDLLLSSLTTYLNKPIVTIIDPRSDHIKRSLSLRYPELEETVTLQFITKTLEGDDNGLDQDDIKHINEMPPITCSYICLPQASSSLSVAIAFQSLMQRHGWGKGPILTRLSTGGAIPHTEAGVSHLKESQLIGFGGLKSMVSDTGVLDAKADGLARMMHERYAEISDNDQSNMPWESLSEDKRDSNRRVVMHFAAKISSMGVDIEPWLKECDQNSEKANLPTFDPSIQNEELSEALAALEHERWMADRRINGWQHSKERDDKKRHHPDLIPYGDLSEKTKEYDRVMVKELFTLLHQQGNNA